MSGSADRPEAPAETGDEATEAVARGSCPICRKPRVFVYRPFCSKRCADLDLARWFSGAYAVPAAEGDDAEDEGEH